MKWSFLAGLLASAAILSPLSASAKAETLSSAHLISGKLLRSKFGSSVLGKTTKGDSQQVMQREAQAKVLTMDTLGRGGEGVKAKSPDALQLSRGLGSGGGEGGGSPSQHAPSVNTKDISLPGRPMLASQNAPTRGTPADGEKGPSLTSGSSRSAVGSFTMPTPVSITVGQHPEEEGSSVSHSRGGQFRPQAQETSSSSPSHSALSEGSSSEPVSSSGSMGGGGGGSSASQEGGGSSVSQEGVLLKSEAAKEYQKLKAEKAQMKVPTVSSIPVAPSGPVGLVRRVETGFESLSPEALAKAQKNLKKIEKQKSSSQTEGASPKEGSSVETKPVQGAKTSPLPSSVETKPAQKATTSNLSDSKGKSSGTSLLSGGTDDIPLDILQAAEALGFKLTGNYKDEVEAKRALKRAAYVKQESLNKELDKTSTTDVKYTRLWTELNTLTAHETTLLKYLERKYDKKNPNEEEIKAAEALGFKLGGNYKDEVDAKRALKRAAYVKQESLNKELDKTSTTDVKYTRLWAELNTLTAYETTLLKYLQRRYPVAKKGFGSIKVSGKDFMEQLRAFGGQSSQTTGGGKTTKKASNLKEMGEELTALDKELRRAEEELHAAVRADEDDDTVKDLTAKVAKFKQDRLTKIIAYNAMREEEKPSGTKKPVVVKVDSQKVLQEQEALRLFKLASPTVAPFVEILEPKDQANFLKRKMTILYNANTREPVAERLSGHGSTLEREENIVTILGKMTQKERDALKEHVGGLEKSARYSALAFLPNYFKIAKYKFPALEKPVPVVKAKKAPTAKATPDVVVGAKKPSAPKQPEAPRKTIKEMQQELLQKGLPVGKLKLPVKGSGSNDDKDPH